MDKVRNMQINTFSLLVRKKDSWNNTQKNQAECFFEQDDTALANLQGHLEGE